MEDVTIPGETMELLGSITAAMQRNAEHTQGLLDSMWEDDRKKLAARAEAIDRALDSFFLIRGGSVREYEAVIAQLERDRCIYLPDDIEKYLNEGDRHGSY